jgi:hypothetical protein
MLENLIGKVFGRLTVIDSLGATKKGSRLWLCRCICGTEKAVITASLTTGRVNSCGCSRNGKKVNLFTLDYVKKEALKLGRWKIIDIEYKGSDVRLKCVCIKCGAHHTISWDNIKQNKGCSNCKKLVYVPRKSIQEIKESFEKEGYILLTKVYKNNRQKLEYECPIGHRHSVTWANWNSNKRRCPYCDGNAKFTIEYIRSLFEKEGYIVIGEYKNSTIPIKYKCPMGHEHSVRIHDWKNGDRCPYCSPGAVKRNLTTEIVAAELAEEGYKLLSKYVNNKSKFLYECPIGHMHTITYGGWHQGRRCPECVPYGTSAFEQDVKKYIRNIDISFIENDRTVIINPNTNCPLELDLWFPQLNKAIECDGAYWHQDDISADRDVIKTEKCKQLNISLLRVDYNAWMSDRKQCQQNILNFLKEGTKLKQLEVFDGYKQSVQK